MNATDTSVLAVGAAPAAARELVATGIRRTSADSLWDELTVDVDNAVTDVLEPFLAADTSVLHQLQATRTGRQSWLALEGDRAAALLSLTLRRVEPGDLEFSYLPPRYAALGMAGTLVDRRSDLPVLRNLYAQASEVIMSAGIDEVTVQVRAGDWVLGSFWRELGFRPDGVLAARISTTPLDAPKDVLVRPAVAGDVEALVEMARQEQDFHALHTRTGTVAGQPLKTTRQTVDSWLAADASAPTLVAEDSRRGDVVGCAALMILTAPAGTARASYLPATHGYIGLVNVDESARGRGIGRALTAGAIRWFAEHRVEPVLLHYIDDNPLSRPFWSRMGFAPVAEILRGRPVTTAPGTAPELRESEQS